MEYRDDDRDVSVQVRMLMAGLLPSDATWTPVDGGESGCSVFLDAAGGRYAKVAATADTASLSAERDRVRWLADTGIPCPIVLDWRTTDRGACLITTAVRGVPADRLDPTELARAWPSIIDTVRRLHGIPIQTCPFERGLADMMALARDIVAEQRVNVDFLPRALVDTPPTQILAELERELPLRVAQEADDAVVCHGDACLPNVLIDPDTLLVTGLIDLARLGRADPYADIALLLTNARETWPDDETARRADDELAARFGMTLDPARLDFHLRLDPLTW